MSHSGVSTLCVCVRLCVRVWVTLGHVSHSMVSFEGSPLAHDMGCCYQPEIPSMGQGCETVRPESGGRTPSCTGQWALECTLLWDNLEMLADLNPKDMPIVWRPSQSSLSWESVNLLCYKPLIQKLTVGLNVVYYARTFALMLTNVEWPLVHLKCHSLCPRHVHRNTHLERPLRQWPSNVDITLFMKAMNKHL